ncbi:MAG TPA: Tex-like N-terminal domain-containing protein, partial [Candidatus Eisenbacteria bacterium]|nr:Tex-like N-terminal domain-containing protein [Candidatus Eisenbacteria bacterium]
MRSHSTPEIVEVARELGLRPAQVEGALALSEGGATVPFIARYRKEATGGLDEVRVQAVLDGVRRRRELEARRTAVVASVEQQGRMTPDLARALAAAGTRAELEDLYLPYRPKRRTRATIARERGLESLADLVWRQQAGGDAAALVAPFVDPERGVPDAASALAGARDICAERVSESAPLRGLARKLSAREGLLRSDVVPARRGERTRFEDHYGRQEPLASAPSHRVLAAFRGEAEGVLRVRVLFPDEEVTAALVSRVVTRPGALFGAELEAAVRDGWERLLRPSLESELRAELKERADRAAIEVFGENLRHLLLAPPAAGRRVVAIDPGLRTGLKVAALDGTGRLLETATLSTERGARERERAAAALSDAVARHRPDLVAVGNGTGSREAEAFVREALAQRGSPLPVVSVSEQGASVYSASEVARQELPELDVSLRGAVSIGRRLQDPLAELVKIDPRSIGVGQYQHDVDAGALLDKLGEVVDSCVNAVGVDVNSASPQLLEHVSGVGPVLARRIVEHRERQGPFPSRAALRRVAGLGVRTFELAAGFLHVRGGQPLDDSAVHPERYGLVERMARDLGADVRSLVGAPALARRIEWRRYVSGDVGEPTLRDILAELEKPGRDPRGDFSAPAFREDLRSL